MAVRAPLIPRQKGGLWWLSIALTGAILMGLVAPSFGTGNNKTGTASRPMVASHVPHAASVVSGAGRTLPNGQVARGIAAVSILVCAAGVWFWLLRRAVRKRTLEVEAALKVHAEFLAMMSHEIRTPMNGIVGMIDIALTTDLTAEQRQYLEFGKDSAEGLLVVLNDILDFSKIEAGRLEMEKQFFEIRTALKRVLGPLLFRARLKGISLVCDTDPAVPVSLLGDSGRLGQILNNLLSNAVKFTEEGGEIVLRVRPAQITGTTVELEFSVSDTGIGIPANKIERLFQPFSQVDGSITRKYSGTGLGLSISRRLVGLMGGKIWVHSVEGKGSTFTFTARFEIGPAVSGKQVEAAEQRAGGLSDTPLRILLAEDNPVSQKVARLILKQNPKWQVVAVATGPEAVRAACAEHFDVVLMDIYMPEMDGFTATSLIRREHSGGKHLPIIALTASAMSGDREKCLAAGLDDYISKPFKRDELLHKIENAVTRSRNSNGGTGRQKHSALSASQSNS